ncbi:acyltransferase family protein [Bradyrhizobium sp. Tv2a-2]|uniref:acyltransferase family protein n=1 Tax=Bradyrhizobium sp. Tv2a-2 TaxID=113395 RepID=UPI000410DD9C|nr:acyltransferase family protein [Bradyrhizobium sp. Tv2a-2]
MQRAADHERESKTTAERIIPFDRARTFITFSVVLYHSTINYTHFGIGGDRMRWLGFDLVVLFNDSYFMACMFFISGLFVHGSLMRRGAADFLEMRGFRLGIPFLVSILVVMPIAYYRYYFTEFDFLQFWRHMIVVGPWSSGSAWFLWVLLVLNALAVLVWRAAPQAIGRLSRRAAELGDRPMAAFAAFLLFSVVIYLPPRIAFGDATWFTPGHYPFPIQDSRILLYAGYFFAGAAVGAAGLRAGLLAETGEIARRWWLWALFALIFYGAILLFVYVHHNWISDFRSPPLWWHMAYALSFALFCASMTFTVPAAFLRFAQTPFRLLDAMRPSAYGIYLLHFVPLLWLQYLVYDPAFPAFVKFAIVFAGTLSASWAMTIVLRKFSVVARMI